MATSAPPPGNPPPKVQKTTLTFKSDIRKSQFDSSPCRGVLHAFRGREEHSFAWVADYDLVESALGHLERFGFVRDKVQFIPYSSKTNWVSKYPHAFPYVDCDEGGIVSGFPYWSPHANSALDIPPEVVHVAAEPATASAIDVRSSSAAIGSKAAAAAIVAGRKKTGSGNRLADTLLSNSERNQLHNEIYNYFSWLANQIVEMETSESGRRAVKKADLSATGLKGVMIKLENTFKSVQKMKIAANDDDNEGKTSEDDETPPFPILEESLLNEMNNLAAVEEEAQKKHRVKVKAEAAIRKKNAHWEPLDFETMFQKLVEYKEEHGNPNVPVKYGNDVQLGGWVSGLRTKKKAYDKDGQDASYNLDDGAAWSLLENEESAPPADGDVDGDVNVDADAKPPASPAVSQKYLNPTRIQALESIGFAWNMARPKSKPKSWDERLEELQQWYLDNSTWKVPRSTSLGEWLHNQRTLYGKRDTKFMTRKAPRLEAIGYAFDLRESTAVSWDDRFQQLVEYHKTHGNFEVPCPISEEAETNGDVGNSEEVQDKYKFYKWVSRLHNEYRAYEKGTSSKLDEERVEKLKGVNFQFKGPKSRGRPSTGNVVPVPNLPWEKRIQQMESFKHDTGHLDVDHNYKHCSNLGGWASDTSTLYKDWKSGSQHLSEDMIAKFNQLTAIGFEFNVLPYYESNRSWDDHYAVLLKFKEGNNGSARVPLKYKADLRLGKWVQSQRQQYKILQEGRKSKLTTERFEKLQSAGFEWALMPGSSTKEEDEDEEMEDQV